MSGDCHKSDTRPADDLERFLEELARVKAAVAELRKEVDALVGLAEILGAASQIQSAQGAQNAKQLLTFIQQANGRLQRLEAFKTSLGN